MSGNQPHQGSQHGHGSQVAGNSQSSGSQPMDIEKSGEKENWAEIHDKINKQMEEIKKEQREIGPLISDKVDLGTLQFEFPENSNFLLKIMVYKLIYQETDPDLHCISHLETRRLLLLPRLHVQNHGIHDD